MSATNCKQCLICCETFTKQKRKEISCPSCHQPSCLACWKTFLSDHACVCMYETCKQPLPLHFILSHFPTAWVQHTWYPHMVTMVMTFEQSLLQQTQYMLDKRNKHDELQRQWRCLSHAQVKHSNLMSSTACKTIEAQASLATLRGQTNLTAYDAWRNVCNDDPIETSYKCLTLLEVLVSNRLSKEHDGQYYAFWHMAQTASIQERWQCITYVSSLVQQCFAKITSSMMEMEKTIEQMNDQYHPCFTKGCFGFVKKTTDNAKQTCPACRETMCLDCFTTCDADVHVCDESKRQAVETLLDSGAKACPNCKVYLLKSDGCDVMFCVTCKTSFDWKTGSVIHGFAHNPHYLDHLQSPQPHTLHQVLTKCTEPFESALGRDELHVTQKALLLLCGKAFDILYVLQTHTLPQMERETNRAVRFFHLREDVCQGIMDKKEWHHEIHADLLQHMKDEVTCAYVKTMLHDCTNALVVFYHKLCDAVDRTDVQSICTSVEDIYTKIYSYITTCNEKEEALARQCAHITHEPHIQYLRIGIPSPTEIRCLRCLWPTSHPLDAYISMPHVEEEVGTETLHETFHTFCQPGEMDDIYFGERKDYICKMFGVWVCDTSTTAHTSGERAQDRVVSCKDVYVPLVRTVGDLLYVTSEHHPYALEMQWSSDEIKIARLLQQWCMFSYKHVLFRSDHISHEVLMSEFDEDDMNHVIKMFDVCSLPLLSSVLFSSSHQGETIHAHKRCETMMESMLVVLRDVVCVGTEAFLDCVYKKYCRQEVQMKLSIQRMNMVEVDGMKIPMWCKWLLTSNILLYLERLRERSVTCRLTTTMSSSSLLSHWIGQVISHKVAKRLAQSSHGKRGNRVMTNG